MKRPVATDEPDRPTFPDVAASIGEDPARFLCGTRELAAARIRGLERLETANAYLAIARRLDVAAELKRAIEDRRDELEEIGDLEDRLEDAEPRELRDRDVEVVWLDEDGEPRDRESVDDRIQRAREKNEELTP